MITTETSGTPEAWRTAVGLVAATMDDDQTAFDVLLADVAEPVRAGLIAALAIICTRLLLATAETPAAAREGVALFALQVAEDCI